MPDKKNFSIILQTSSYDSTRSGILVPPVIGSARALYEERNLNVLIIFLTAALVFLMSAYHVVRFILKREELTNLILGGFGFLAMVEILLETAHIPCGLFRI
jgi:hypothetical protein